jgi:fibronectin type 3 domain-containing protein
MKLWTLATFCTASLLILSGCATSPKPGGEATIDASLPIVELTKNGVVADMNAVAFEWKSVADPKVKGIYVYKMFKDSSDSGDDYYATINNKYITHYLDTDIKPSMQYRYYFKTFNDKAESRRSAIVIVDSLPVLKSVSWIHSIQGMPRSAKIIWRPHANKKVVSYIIEKKTLEDDTWEKLTTVDGRLSAEYIDKDLADNRVYKYRIRVKTYDDIISTPSKEVKVITKPLPQAVANIQATRNLPKKIKVTWDKSNDKDFYRYFVYRSEDVDDGYELIAKLHNNYFVDEIQKDGQQYFYRVSVVDKDGLESEYKYNSIQGITLIRPTAPAISEIKLINNKVILTWSKVDPRTVSYIVVKTSKKGWFNATTKEIKVNGTKFVDENIESDATYRYKLFGLDKNGIRSLPSVEAEVKSPKVAVEKVPTSTVEVKDAPADVPVVETEEIIPTQDFN